MQTFLPFADFHESAGCLDRMRLGKQRVETKQILIALGVDVGMHRGNLLSRWRRHPAVRMWRGHEQALCVYGTVVCQEWMRRGYHDTLNMQFVEAYQRIRSENGVAKPAWLGDRAVHASHRSNLLRKDSEHYGQFGWSEPADLEYVWPV